MMTEFHNEYWLPINTMNYLINGDYDELHLSEILLINAFLDDIYAEYDNDINIIFDIQKIHDSDESIIGFIAFPSITGFLACNCYLVNVYVSMPENVNATNNNK